MITLFKNCVLNKKGKYFLNYLVVVVQPLKQIFNLYEIRINIFIQFNNNMDYEFSINLFLLLYYIRFIP